MTILKLLFTLSFSIYTATSYAQSAQTIYKSETLVIKKLTEHAYIHISYLPTEEYGNVHCNGMIVIHNDEAIIFDTPTFDSVSLELVDYLESSLYCSVKGVVINHYHADCLGGLDALHKLSIPSYASYRTIAFAEKNEFNIPMNGFDRLLELPVGNLVVVNEFIGEGHTSDNIVSYFANDKVLFGGCLIKSIGAGKGNLNDANVVEWSNTVRKVKAQYPKANIIIPGHGNPGDQSLLDYTIQKFNH